MSEPVSQTRSLSVVLLVIGTMAFVACLYSICLFLICTRSGDVATGTKALEQFKDFGIFAAGALSGFLARTTTGSETASVKVENTAKDPVPTTDTNTP